MILSITYGELHLSCTCHVEPADKSAGVMSPEITIEEVHLAREYYSRDGVELDMADIEQFILLHKDDLMQELVEEAYDDYVESGVL